MEALVQRPVLRKACDLPGTGHDLRRPSKFEPREGESFENRTETARRIDAPPPPGRPSRLRAGFPDRLRRNPKHRSWACRPFLRNPNSSRPGPGRAPSCPPHRRRQDRPSPDLIRALQDVDPVDPPSMAEARSDVQSFGFRTNLQNELFRTIGHEVSRSRRTGARSLDRSDGEDRSWGSMLFEQLTATDGFFEIT